MFKRPMAMITFACLALSLLVGCGTPSGSSGTGNLGGVTPTAPQTTTTVQASPSATGSSSQSSFNVSGIDMAVTPSSIAGMPCGTSVNVVYTATFHVPANSPGGTVQFVYTVNNGRSSPQASIAFAPGETLKTYAFNWSGNLSPDNVYPGLGGVITSSPNVVRSAMVKPTGTCVLSAAFHVTGIDLTVSPSSIAGRACSTSITLNYTATFHITAGSPGGTIQFAYTTNNGRSQTNASVVVGPAEIVKTYTFTTSGVLYPDHTFPGVAIVMVTSPNAIQSPGVHPTGVCS